MGQSPRAPTVRRVALATVLGTVLGLGTAAVLPALPASARNSAAKLKALSNSINRAKHLTYDAQYTSVSDGQTSTVTIAQSPPKSNFSTGSGSVINNGKATYYCGSGGGSGNSGNSGNSGSGSSTSTTSASSVTCVAVSGSNPLLGLEDAFSPTAALTAFGQAEQTVIARALGVQVSFSSATFAGQASTCVTVKVRGRGGTYCVTKQGLLSYSGTSSTSYFKLVKYSSKPPPSLFSLPAGATTQTLPGRTSISIP